MQQSKIQGGLMATALPAMNGLTDLDRDYFANTEEP